MKKELLKAVLGVFTVLLILCPFYMPESWQYIEKKESIVDPTWELLATISIYVCAFFVGWGIRSMYNELIK